MRLKTLKLKRAVAVLAATCTLGTCCVAGSIAWAAGPESTTVQGANTGNISPTCGVKDSTKKDCTSITIHKYDGGISTTKPTGTKQDVQNRNAVEGVEFTLYKVTLTAGDSEADKKIDLSTAEGWKRIEDIQNLDPNTKNAASFFKAADEQHPAKFTKTKVGEAKKTGTNGEVTFNGLDESLYYVEESDTKDAKVNNKSVTITGKVDPFFITTPLPHKTENSWEWLYNVDVYPKNDTSNDLPTKTPKDPTKLYTDDGDAIIPWDISMPLTPPSDNTAYKKIGFVDSLPEGLTYAGVDEANVKLVKKGKATGSTANDITLQTTDYTATPSSDNKKVTFSLSPSRLAEINKDFKNNTYVLKVTLNTKVAKGTKNVTNSINGWIDDSKIGGVGDEDNPCVPTKDDPKKCDKNPHGTSHFATLKITKVNDAADKAKGKKPLKGAEFAVYVMKNQSADLNTVTKDNLSTTTDPVSKKDKNNTQLTIETGDDGTATVDLFIGNGDNASSMKYCLVEKKAPAGFKLVDTPHCYAVEAETSTNVSATKPVADANSKEIVNSQATELDKILGNLPMTGARGLVILTVCGIVGIAGTLFYVVMKRRKEQEQE